MIIIGIFVALAFFFYMNKRRNRRLEEQQERSKERFENLLDTIRPKEEVPAGEDVQGRGSPE